VPSVHQGEEMRASLSWATTTLLNQSLIVPSRSQFEAVASYSIYNLELYEKFWNLPGRVMGRNLSRPGCLVGCTPPVPNW
jgi:hypothetical protein